jgi:hypothetical protein
VVVGFAAAGVAGLAGLLLPAGTRAGVRQPASLPAAELAQRVFDAPWTVRVVDVRPTAACAARRVPGAECAPEADLAKLRLAEAEPSRLLVVVGEGDGVPPEAEAYRGPLAVLRGGWGAWEAYALTPPTPPPAAAPASEIDAYRIRAGIHSALTGMKAAPPPPPPSATPAGGARKGGGGCSG